ncbi:hypothetical protein VYU27_007851 [Nannochloropsis oceanica]
MKCNREFPCSRCWRLALPCKPRELGKKMRRRAKVEGRNGAEGNAEGGLYEGREDGSWGVEECQVQHHQHRPPGQRKGGEEEQQQQQGWWRWQPEAMISSSLMELCFNRHNPRRQAQTYLEVFHQMLGDGVLDRFKTLQVLKYWKTLSLMAGSDVSQGMSKIIGKAFDITTHEIDSTSPLPIRHAQAAPDSLRALTQDLQHSLSFQREDDGRNAYYMLRFEGQPEGGREGGREQATGTFACAGNPAFQKLFRRTEALVGDVVAYQALQSLLYVSAVAHEDRRLFFRCLIGALFSRTNAPRSEIIKAFKKDGGIDLYLMQTRPHEWPDGRLGILLKLEEVPPSRHISCRPNYQKVAQAFRRRPSQQGAGGGKTGGGGIKTTKKSASPSAGVSTSLSPSLPSLGLPTLFHTVLPGLASFPLPPLPKPPPTSGVSFPPICFSRASTHVAASIFFKSAEAKEGQETGMDGRTTRGRLDEEEKEAEDDWGKMEEDPYSKQHPLRHPNHHHHQRPLYYDQQQEKVEQEQQQQQQGRETEQGEGQVEGEGRDFLVGPTGQAEEKRQRACVEEASAVGGVDGQHSAGASGGSLPSQTAGAGLPLLSFSSASPAASSSSTLSLPASFAASSTTPFSISFGPLSSSSPFPISLSRPNAPAPSALSLEASTSITTLPPPLLPSPHPSPLSRPHDERWVAGREEWRLEREEEKLMRERVQEGWVTGREEQGAGGEGTAEERLSALPACAHMLVPCLSEDVMRGVFQ